MDKGTQELDSLDERVPGLTNVARIATVLSLVVFEVFSTYAGDEIAASPFPTTEFYSWAIVCSVLILLSIFRPDWQIQSLNLPNASAVVGISVMMILVYIVGGLDSSSGILVLPFVAMSYPLSYGHYLMLYAGYASTLYLLNLFLGNGIRFNPLSWDNHSVLTALLLIAASYLVAILTAFAAKYLEQATESASKHQLAYRRISGLNRLVFSRVQEAVIVIDATQRAWLFNKQAKTHFPSLAVDQWEVVFGKLVTRWQYQPDKAFEIDIHTFQYAIHVRAVPLIQEQTEPLILYVCSLREVATEAMSTRLTSLEQLTANLTHEIRSPMSAIRHASGLLQGGEEEDPVRTELYGIIDSDIQRIDKMLEDVSLPNKRDNINREPLDLMKSWLAFKQEFTLNNPDAVGYLRMNMEGSNLIVLVGTTRVQQIMWNLCNNAWRYSRQNENVITVLIRPSGRMYISIVVADSGKDVSAGVRDHLFEPFYTTEKQGTGLDLYVARELAHANMGQLHYHPEMNGFELILPRELSK